MVKLNLTEKLLLIVNSNAPDELKIKAMELLIHNYRMELCEEAQKLLLGEY